MSIKNRLKDFKTRKYGNYQSKKKLKTTNITYESQF